ncbi:ATP-binding cassette domain-containing protein [Bdellovibrio bacteriovorus]|uniref:ATP-binding cassette domain-containing protein n=1 Tax=Bdellovibrio bacteriovorus TaxID=959 RepID=UPI0021D3954F|nr:ATP-binding cassette domain-containing protein [Bdellovibrio bacteriovorus]UXR64286.1 ATP-binding cassette domain-containing protein [Bdellovibrio bacteriovorus]
MKSLLHVNKVRVLSPEGNFLSPEISFDLGEGEVLLLKGENGSGKSSFLKTLLGLHKPFTGNFNFEVPLQDVQYLPQLGNLHFHLPLTLRDVLNSEPASNGLLKNLDLNKKWNTASGGERQKVLLTSALAKKPRLLVLDEPFNHVDQESGHILEEALSFFLNEHPQSSLILVSHRPLLSVWKNLRSLEIR